eukprot:6196715-Pleurochrysis_carterae.AAC.3
MTHSTNRIISYCCAQEHKPSRVYIRPRDLIGLKSPNEKFNQNNIRPCRGHCLFLLPSQKVPWRILSTRELTSERARVSPVGASTLGGGRQRAPRDGVRACVTAWFSEGVVIRNEVKQQRTYREYR